MPHILIVEDDLPAARVLAGYLKAQGLDSSIVEDGLEAVPEIRRGQPDLVLLDLTLPGQDGVAVCREVRAFSQVPIIMFTGRMEEMDRLTGLDVGADDYVCKPLATPREVVARIKAVLRRAEGSQAAVSAPGFHVDEQAMRIAWQSQWLPLTPLEFRLLKQLLSRPGRVFSRADLLESVHEDFRDTTDRAIDTHIKNLRKKIASVRPQGAAIVSVDGVGYRFDPDAQEPA